MILLELFEQLKPLKWKVRFILCMHSTDRFVNNTMLTCGISEIVIVCDD